MTDLALAEALLRLQRIAREAQNTYVGRNWPTMADMRRDGIGFGLVENAANERCIRRYLDTFQPEFVVSLLADYARLRKIEEAARALMTPHTLTTTIPPRGEPTASWTWPEWDALRAALEKGAEG